MSREGVRKIGSTLDAVGHEGLVLQTGEPYAGSASPLKVAEGLP